MSFGFFGAATFKKKKKNMLTSYNFDGINKMCKIIGNERNINIQQLSGK